MFRTANERKHLRVVAQYHLSKNWIYPEQAPACTREKLEDIDMGIIKYCGIHKGRVVKRPRKLYESAKLNNANDVFFDSRFKDRPAEYQIFAKEREASRPGIQEQNANHRDVRNGKLTDHNKEAEEFLEGYDCPMYSSEPALERCIFEEERLAVTEYEGDKELDYPLGLNRHGEYKTEWGDAQGYDLHFMFGRTYYLLHKTY